MRFAARPGTARKVFRLSCAALAIGMLGISQVAPAGAQVVGSISVESDVRFRGYSMSNGDPAATIDLGYEHRSGLYLNGAATAGVVHSDPVLLGYQLNAGYSTWVSPTVSIDAGVVRNAYTRHARGIRDTHYTEFYLGMATRGISSRIYYSPDYFRPDKHTLYGELEGTLNLAPKWRLNGHVGLLTYLNDAPRNARREHYDWRVTLGRSLGKLDLRASLSSAGPGNDYYYGRRHSATALTFGASLPF